jgi:D-alanine--(R)-lactate ligase
MRRPKVAIVFGGASEEHPISRRSAQEVARHLHLGRYEPFWVGISEGGAWTLCDGPGASSLSGLPAVLSPDRGVHGLLVLQQGRYESVRLDAVLPVLHGTLGEDGAIQGLLELSGIPYVGCGVASSALCMDKSLAYTVVRDAGIATPGFRIVTAADVIDAHALAYPVFVKPARSGSSFGVTKVVRAEALAAAIAEARRYDAKTLIEEAVTGSEVGCAILGSGSDLLAGEVDRISLSDGFFRIHQEADPERGSDNATVTVPADIPAAARDLVRETAKTIYRALGCRGLARVDLFLRDDDTVVLNEVNTFPGMTSYSRFPRMLAAAGVPFAEVLDRLLADALEGRDGA